MNRYVPYLGGVAAVVVVVVVFVILDASAPQLSPVSTSGPQDLSIASSTPEVLDEPVEVLSTSKVQPAPPDAAKKDLTNVAAQLREAVVNVWCQANSGGKVHSISGSGVFVDSKGYILTNAHVAQYFLLKDRGVSCTIRNGSPAQEAYQAELVYLSPIWIDQNARNIVELAPVGTGEHDVALLVVTNPGAQVPAIQLAAVAPEREEPVAIVSYAAQYLSEAELVKALFPTVVLSHVQEVLTFSENTPDVLGFGGSVAAQEGASGGGVVSASGELVGIVTTSKVTGPLEGRSVTAITTPYIQSEYAAQAGRSIDVLLATAPTTAIAQFAPTAAQLQKILEKVLDGE